MAKRYDNITTELREFIEQQPLFFVATAPLSAEGHVNLSPKGLDAFRVLDAQRVAYLDLTGSGNETAAHVIENGRITFMFCAFTGRPKIVRLYGRARVILSQDEEWPALISGFTVHVGARQVVLADITLVQTSCGFGVPLMDYVGQRDTLPRWAESKGEEGLAAYRLEKNSVSLDGSPVPLSEATTR